ncbi:MAG: AIPR family protein [Ramlibacter sp.]|nr:AIPR family protein [Ramlibacter sp.]
MTEQEFYVELGQMVQRRAASEHLVDTLAFVREVAERLEDDPVFGEFVPAEFSGSNRRNRQFRLHGFTRLDDSDGSVGLVVGRYSDAEAPETLTSTAVTQLSGYLETFVQEAIESSLSDRVAEVNEAYELATLLGQGRGRVSRVRLHILSNQPLSQRFKEQLCDPVDGVAVERHIWDLQRLQSLFESSREREVISIEMSEFDSEGIEAMQAAVSESLLSYLCIIPGNTLADMFNRYGSRLLEGNVRSFLGMKGGVNKGIRRTLQDTPELFFAYNNGIAATASSVSVNKSDGRIRITGLVDLQIVNGGQTTASVLSARKKDGLSLAGVSVAMKLTVVSSDDANDLIPRIAEYANTQNKVAIADFFANHPFHRKMEEISRRLAVPAKTGVRVASKWFYERSRGQYQNERLYLTEAKKTAFDLEFPSAQMINKTDLAKYDSAFNERPHWVSLGAQKNFLKFATTFEPFASDTSISEYWTTISPKYGDGYFQRIVAMALIWKYTETLVSSGRGDWYLGDYRAQIVAYAVALVLRNLRVTSQEIDHMRIWQLQSVPSDLGVVLKDAAIAAQNAILSPPQGMTNVGEWTKKEGCWDAVRQLRLSMPEEALWVVSRQEARGAATDARRQGEQDDAISLQRRLLSLSEQGYWRNLMQWSDLASTVTESQRALVSKASTVQGFMKITLEKDWRRLADVQRVCEEAGFRVS